MKCLWIATVVLALGMFGCAGDQGEQAGRARDSRAISIEFRAASDGPHEGYLQMALSGSSRKLYVSQEVELAVDAVAHAELDTLDREHPAVALTLTESGAKAFTEITRARIGKRVAILVDGLLVSAPLVMAEISNGRAVIEGRFSREEAERIVSRINGE